MLRKALLGVIAAVAALAMLATAAGAEPFNPSTQSHEGACARETTSVRQAVHDYAANGVLSDFADLVGIHPPRHRLVKTMERRLVVARVSHRVVTANHGCDGEGHWFPVGPRTLNRGEKVGVKVSSKLRSKLCLKGHRHCRRIVVEAAWVFPITCWNPNFGKVDVVLYVRRQKKHKKPRKQVKHAKEEAAPTTPPPPAPPPAPVADPAASAAQLTCSEGAGLVVTLSNGSTATASASFLVNGKAYGPIAPGGTATADVALSPGESTVLTVSSGTTTLISGEKFTNACMAKPFAKILGEVEGCQEKQEFVYHEFEIEFGNEASATLPTTIKVEWSHNENIESKEFVAIAPGKTEKLSLLIGPPPFVQGPEPPSFESGEIIVTANGVATPLLSETELPIGC